VAAADADVSLASIREVRPVVEAASVRTPVLDGQWLGARVGGSVAFKAECLQRTGSFKVRGVAARLGASGQDLGSGVVAASAGNHGQALAHIAAVHNVPCHVFMPTTASVSKARAIERSGARLELREDSVDGCLEDAREFAAAHGATLVHPFDDPLIILGQATIGLELLEQVPDLATVIVPVGGGGLAGGMAAALKQLKPDVRVVGVQAEICAPFAQGASAVSDVRFALADGIAIKRPGELTAPLVERYVDDLCTVPEDAIAEAIVALLEGGKLVVEGAGAVSVAALMTGAVRPAESGDTVAILSGGNIDLRRLAAATRMHEATQDTIVHIATKVPDHPGGLASLLATIAGAQANVLSVEHVRDAGPRGYHETGVELILETRGADHGEALRGALAEQGYEIVAMPTGAAPEPPA